MAIAVLHVSELSGPARTLAPRLEWLSGRARLESVFPRHGPATDLVAGVGAVTTMPYEALTVPSGPLEAAAMFSRMVSETARFVRLFRRRRPDLVVVATTMLPAVTAAARLCGVATIVEAGELLDGGGQRSRARRLAYRALLRATEATADAIVACSEPVARQFTQESRATVTTLYPGIDREMADGDGRGFRKLHRIDPADHCLLAVGSLTSGRGQDVLLRALPAIAQQVPNVHCVLVGAPHQRAVDLAYAAELRRLTYDLGIEGRVTFCAQVATIADAYAAADVVVNPAADAREAFGRVAFEALMAGRPVVSTTDGAIGELLRDRTDALLVSPGSPSEIAEAVLELAGDPELARALVAAGRRRVVETFSTSRSVDGFVPVVESVVACPAQTRRQTRLGSLRTVLRAAPREMRAAVLVFIAAFALYAGTTGDLLG